jgi:hypothetical protein
MCIEFYWESSWALIMWKTNKIGGYQDGSYVDWL